ncbi:hypothetical protein SLEP1_g18681 [Rubroshorea leprosula]|uniref:Reverse transcriptase zinc-binding domain-containing protein n=1 Tax=Rubroshorea leprosula TaxID=152421 RepID=A0AAV5J3W4_9ROSI|nr:hypothetical protein SLEP1_g18681 [Rubroshorea leprosula]
MTGTDTCVLCGEAAEDREHLFFACGYSTLVGQTEQSLLSIVRQPSRLYNTLDWPVSPVEKLLVSGFSIASFGAFDLSSDCKVRRMSGVGMFMSLTGFGFKMLFFFVSRPISEVSLRLLWTRPAVAHQNGGWVSQRRLLRTQGFELETLFKLEQVACHLI